MSESIKKLSYFGGKIVPESEANINIKTHALQYGTTVFGGIRGYYDSATDNVYVFRILDHYKRLVNSTRIMQLKFDKSPEQLRDITLELLKASGYRQNVYLRPFVYTSALQLSPRFHDVATDLAIYVLELDDYLDTKRGLTTMVSSWRRFDDTVIPTLSKVSGGYVNSALAKSEAVQNGFDEAIFLDGRGFVSEGSAENIFLVRDGKIITPSIASSLLEGITRRSVLQIAKDFGYEVIERDVTRSELYISDEIFFSGTGVQIAWVSEVDRRTIGTGKIGPVTQKLQSTFFELVKGKIPEYKHWLTPVY
ncbi:branched chain amino acid aminotransferase [Leptospira perolatii]|uniref:Branched-chain-amino-acid aminotransferase n=1 Tax=Leptospira perolatii TaxID=2023191 RepID=A0A2M9ZRM1_9LEPT|nr:branched-chain amino acid transaminase [Leptospira perolatii]PJZ71077.1 branched chain amino acid aminotransferase [Leptospira perolatii]PJZ74609.1 branched chain amino acid aminotransferase [Leptospira perolatii]